MQKPDVEPSMRAVHALRRGFCATCGPGPRITPIVQTLPSLVPFVAPEEMERARGRPFAVRLGANESTVGPSPLAVAAMQLASADAWMYGDPTSHKLRLALAEQHGVAAENIVVGEGIDGVLSSLTHLLVGAGDTVVGTHGSYPTFNFSVAGRGGSLHAVPYGDDDRHDVDALLQKAVEVDAKAIYLVNPDNPSGSSLEPERIEALIDGLPAGTLLVIDEAYSELAGAGFRSPTVDVEDPRVLRLRTFSKAYGLAGARVGYALGERTLISAFDRVRNHFGVGRVSQAGALAALGDREHLAQTQLRNAEARDFLARLAREHGLTPLPSDTNFVTIDCGGGPALANAVLLELLERDCFVRMPGAAPLDRCVRVSCGTPQQMAFFAAALPAALEAARAKVSRSQCSK